MDLEKTPQIKSWRPIETSNLTQEEEEKIVAVIDKAIAFAKANPDENHRKELLEESPFTLKVGKQANFEEARNDEIPEEDLSIVSKDGKFRINRIKWGGDEGRVDNTLQITDAGLVTKIDVPAGESVQEAVDTAHASDEFNEMLAKKFLIDVAKYFEKTS